MYALVARIVIHPNHSSNSDSEKHLKTDCDSSLICLVTVYGGSGLFVIRSGDLFKNTELFTNETCLIILFFSLFKYISTYNTYL